MTSVPDGELRAAMRGLCVDAHRQGLFPEELILLLKTTWTSRPNLGPMRGETNVILEHLITLCIAEYYASSSHRIPGTLHATPPKRAESPAALPT